MRKYLRPAAVLFLIAMFVSLSHADRAAASNVAAPVRGRVLAVENNLPGWEWETQFVTVRLTTGPNKNETITLLNTLTGHPYFDLRVKRGDRVVLEADTSSDAIPPRYYLVDYSRRGPLWELRFVRPGDRVHRRQTGPEGNSFFIGHGCCDCFYDPAADPQGL